jgi:hypothetical protein
MDNLKPMLVWKVKTKGYNVVWDNFTNAMADFLDLRSQDIIVDSVFIFPMIISKYRYHSMKEFQGW